MSYVSADAWTCPTCGGTERLPVAPPERDAARSAAQLRHGDQHRREGRGAMPLHEALSEALALIEGSRDPVTGAPFVARVLAHPRDVERLRFEIARRRARVAIAESLAVQPGNGLPLPPVAGIDRRGSLR
jgi:hypothetical protein